MIMLRSASPSAAAPKAGGSAAVSISRPSLLRPIAATSSTACVKLGSAWPCEGGRSRLPCVPRGADARPPPWMLAATEAPRAMPQLALCGGRRRRRWRLQLSARRARRVAWLSEHACRAAASPAVAWKGSAGGEDWRVGAVERYLKKRQHCATGFVFQIGLGRPLRAVMDPRTCADEKRATPPESVALKSPSKPRAPRRAVRRSSRRSSPVHHARTAHDAPLPHAHKRDGPPRCATPTQCTPSTDAAPHV